MKGSLEGNTVQPAEDNEEMFAGAAESDLIKEERCQEKEKSKGEAE